MNDFREFSPAALSAALDAGEVVLVDVREPPEYRQARIEGAILHPLSSFDPATLPAGEIVLQCGVGKRSLMAAQLCARAGVRVAGHLEGGLSAWAASGLLLVSG